MNVKKYFTLVEMLVVIVVIGIMLSIILLSGWKNVSQLQIRNEKETILSKFNLIRSNSLSSNYYRDVKYEKLFFGYNFDKNSFKVGYMSGNDEKVIENIYLKDSYISGNANFTVYFQPYETNCVYHLNGNIDNNTYIQLVSKNKRYSYCFIIDLNVCKIKEYKCLDVIN